MRIYKKPFHQTKHCLLSPRRILASWVAVAFLVGGAVFGQVPQVQFQIGILVGAAGLPSPSPLGQLYVGTSSTSLVPVGAPYAGQYGPPGWDMMGVVSVPGY